MSSDTRNVKLGVCTVTFDGVDLGYTKGGVEVEIKTETKKVMVDQFGNSEINEYILGRTCSAKVPLAETTMENMARIMPGATLYATGAVKASGSITFSTGAPVTTDKISVNGVDFNYLSAPLTPHDIDVDDVTTVDLAASSLAAAINNSIDPRVSTITAVAVGAVVTITADDAGTAGNAVTITKSFTTPANATIVGMANGANATKKKVTVPNGIGISLLFLAKRLVLHPVANDATNRSEDFIIPLAMTPGEMNFSFKLDDERIFNCGFTAYPDPDTKVLFVVGDETAS